MFEVKWLLIKCAAGVFARKVVEPGGSRAGAVLGAPLPAVWPGLEAAVALVEPGTCHVSLALNSQSLGSGHSHSRPRGLSSAVAWPVVWPSASDSAPRSRVTRKVTVEPTKSRWGTDFSRLPNKAKRRSFPE